MSAVHEHYMAMALQLAQTAAEEGETPTGCVIIDGYSTARTESPVLGRAYNQVELLRDPTAHAEMLAITQATEALGDWRLTNTMLYVTKEPCTMCAGAIILARVPLVVMGVADPERGGHSVFNIFAHPNLNHSCEYIFGVLEAPCLAILQEFFRNRRAAETDLNEAGRMMEDQDDS
jgi:tRNA(adenine34) deaminase